ncbi:ATP-dependent Clp protease ATP-binding subunit ClpA [Schaalia hyovaginalis]|uniref:ATP-dependent Clp protease ATP-binding subunit ClpA n=2 Tax=Schaalia hyovaginalis TaxID=29316 RepID=A0A923E0Y3_9ACTO|nr:ATP-dependent Clp protease ATP-binding subunit ClpA [Schaalia hyovaginalis]
MIAKLAKRMEAQDMRLQLTDAARDLLADLGFDPVLGARPLRRAIQREIEDALSERILFGEITAGQVVTVGVEGEGKERKFTFNGQ